MKSKKAFIKLDGEIGEREQPCIEYVDNSYLDKMEQQKNKLKDILSQLPDKGFKKMQRIAMLLKIKSGKKNDYLEAHKNVWPEILTALKEANIHKNSTFVNDDLLFMYLEYAGKDFASDWKKYGENPKVIEWFSILKNYLEPYEQPIPPFRWSMLQEVFHAD